MTVAGVQRSLSSKRARFGAASLRLADAARASRRVGLAHGMCSAQFWFSGTEIRNQNSHGVQGWSLLQSDGGCVDW